MQFQLLGRIQSSRNHQSATAGQACWAKQCAHYSWTGSFGLLSSSSNGPHSKKSRVCTILAMSLWRFLLGHWRRCGWVDFRRHITPEGRIHPTTASFTGWLGLIWQRAFLQFCGNSRRPRVLYGDGHAKLQLEWHMQLLQCKSKHKAGHLSLIKERTRLWADRLWKTSTRPSRSLDGKSIPTRRRPRHLPLKTRSRSLWIASRHLERLKTSLPMWSILARSGSRPWRTRGRTNQRTAR